MAARWSAENDQILLVKFIETHQDQQPVRAGDIVNAWPKNREAPTARAVTEHVARLRKKWLPEQQSPPPSPVDVRMAQSPQAATHRERRLSASRVQRTPIRRPRRVESEYAVLHCQRPSSPPLPPLRMPSSPPAPSNFEEWPENAESPSPPAKRPQFAGPNSSSSNATPPSEHCPARGLTREADPFVAPSSGTAQGPPLHREDSVVCAPEPPAWVLPGVGPVPFGAQRTGVDCGQAVRLDYGPFELGHPPLRAQANADGRANSPPLPLRHRSAYEGASNVPNGIFAMGDMPFLREERR